MKRLINMYIDDSLKNQCTEKLAKYTIETGKGQFSALVRSLLQMFMEEQDEQVLNSIAARTLENYMESQTGRRSKL